MSSPLARHARSAVVLALAAQPAPHWPQDERASSGAQLALPPELARAEDVTNAGLAFVELAVERDTRLVGEPFELRLAFGFELEFLGANLVQLFQRPLDVPAQAFAPALESLDGALLLDAGEPEEGVTFALGERIARAVRAGDQERGGKTYARFEFSRRLAATRAGELVVPAPSLRFARATRFEEGFVAGRLALDRSDVLVRGAELRLDILPLPEEGRPAEFTGAVGRFTLEATAEPRELEVGASLALTLRITALDGQGDLSQCGAPSPELAGFHVRGSLLERAAHQLSVRFDLAPLDAGVRALPPIRFVFFDTTPPAGYRTIASAAIPLVVRARRATPSAAPPLADARASRELFPWLGLGLLGLALGLALARRHRSRTKGR